MARFALIHVEGFNASQGTVEGFTLVELLLAMAIMIIVFAASLPLYSNLQWSAQMNEAQEEIIGDIRLARTLSVQRDHDGQYGFFIDTTTNRAIFFKGSSYATRDAPYDRITSFPTILSFSSSLSNGSSEVSFTKNFGMPSATGTLTLTHTSSGTVRTISINPYGMVQGN